MKDFEKEEGLISSDPMQTITIRSLDELKKEIKYLKWASPLIRVDERWEKVITELTFLLMNNNRTDYYILAILGEAIFSRKFYSTNMDCNIAEYKRPLAYFDIALKELPFLLSSALACRGEILRKFGDLDKAEKDLDKAIESDSNNALALASKGKIELSRGSTSKVLLYLNYALKIEPYNSFALAIRGEVYRKMHKIQKATMDLQTALAINPCNVNALLSYSAVLLKSDISLAIRQLEKVLLICPDNEAEGMRLAELLSRCGDLPKAVKILKSIIAANPKSVKPLVALGKIYLKCKDRGNALKAFQQAHEIDPNDQIILNRIEQLKKNLILVNIDNAKGEIKFTQEALEPFPKGLEVGKQLTF